VVEDWVKDIPREEVVRGAFNKDVLLNTFFEHTELFSPAANKFTQTGKYCGEPFRSKKYMLFWEEEKERCLHGYENPVTKLWIPGKYYFFLNYKQMQIIPEGEKTQKRAKRITTFPRFWPIHYFFSLDYQTATAQGLNLCVIKPRDTGFSELLSSFGVHEYTFQTEDPVFYFTAVERFLIKNGVLTKAWDQLNFLNDQTERAFKHLRQYNDSILHKRASYEDPERRIERKTGGEIIGAVVDHPRKLRGARGYVNFEEAGSFPQLVDCWMTAKDLAEQGGVKFAHMCAWGTGGEQGPGIEGLDMIFNNPVEFDCLTFDNCWEEDQQQGRPHGFFFPCWANMTRFMDKWGNTDFAKAKAFRDEERERLAKKSQLLLDKRVSEQPYTPSEALMRIANNPFPIVQLQKQLRFVDNSPAVAGILKRGELEIDEGKVVFRLNPKAEPVDRYPHPTDQIVNGCMTLFEAPLRDDFDRVPANLYYIIADCFAVDTEQATDWNSLGAFYVYKRKNNVFPTEDDILVAWYAGRPPRVRDFHRRVFLAARYYNAIVQTEIKGGGQELLNYARNHNLVDYCGERPTIFNQDKDAKKVSGRQFFVRIEDTDKPERLQKLADWLQQERSLKMVGDEAQYVLNLERIYDRALLEELIKFRIDGNFDRISCLLVLMTIHQEAEYRSGVEIRKSKRDDFFSRPLFVDGGKSGRQYTLTVKEMRFDPKNNDIIM
jgi:hypothetical protein